jgi:hypothetical protein
MVEVNENQNIDLKKIKELIFFAVKIVVLTSILFWFFGVIDEPQYVGNEVGLVTGCTQGVSRSGSNGNIYCGAKLKNGENATFKSRHYISENESVVFAHYRGRLTGRNSYIASF